MKGHMKFTFTTKEEYLQYRKEWKENYKQLSQQIRDFKFARWYRSLGEKRRTPEGLARYQKIEAKYKTNCFYVRGLKVRATSMLAELKLAKEEAQRQYLAAKAQKEELVTA
jgi:hypothetical protein